MQRDSQRRSCNVPLIYTYLLTILKCSAPFWWLGFLWFHSGTFRAKWPCSRVMPTFWRGHDQRKWEVGKFRAEVTDIGIYIQVHTTLRPRRPTLTSCNLCFPVASAILQGGLFGIVGKFSSRYITAVVSGQALGGIFAALAEIASLCFGASSATSAFVYFMVANVMLLLSLAAYIFLSHSVCIWIDGEGK